MRRGGSGRGQRARGVRSHRERRSPLPNERLTNPTSRRSSFATASVSDLPTTTGSIAIIDTNQPTIKDAATNPTGAICTGKYEGSLYAWSVNCECCKVPLNKAKLLPADDKTGSFPRLSCGFCGATYNVGTGEPVDDAEGEGVGGNMFGGIVKNLMSSQARRR